MNGFFLSAFLTGICITSFPPESRPRSSIPGLRTLLKLAGIAVHFHIYAGSDLVIGVRRQPLGKNLLVQPLQCLRHPPGTREDRPGVGRNGPGGKAIGNLSGGVIKVFQEKRKKLLNNLCCFSLHRLRKYSNTQHNFPR